MSSHVVKPDMLVIALTKCVLSRFSDSPCTTEIRIIIKCDDRRSFIVGLPNVSAESWCVFGGDAGGCRVTEPADYMGCRGCVRPKQLDLPLYSSCLSICLSVTIRSAGIRLKGRISCLLLYCDGEGLLCESKPRGVEMGEQMSSLNGSIIHEAALVTNAPIKRLTLSYMLWIRRAQNVDAIRCKIPQDILNFLAPRSPALSQSAGH